MLRRSRLSRRRSGRSRQPLISSVCSLFSVSTPMSVSRSYGYPRLRVSGRGRSRATYRSAAVPGCSLCDRSIASSNLNFLSQVSRHQRSVVVLQTVEGITTPLVIGPYRRAQRSLNRVVPRLPAKRFHTDPQHLPTRPAAESRSSRSRVQC